MTALHAVREPSRYVRTRRIRFRFADSAPMQKHYVANDIAMSHLVSLLSASFPAGEEAFVRAVQHYADRLTDPTLKQQVKGFVGQEMTHGREHRNLNETLAAMGYPTKIVDEVLKNLEWLAKLVPPLLPLALTAAAEHGTATLAEHVLADPDVQAMATDDETLNLLNWHALEELEHKAVAFDVYRSVGGGEALRIGSSVALAVIAGVAALAATAASMLADPYTPRHPVKTTRSLVNLRKNPLFKGVPRTLVQYVRPGFHPNDIDTDELLAQWQQELFGPDGQLVDHLK